METLCRLDSKTDEIADLTNLTNPLSSCWKIGDNNSLHVILDNTNTKGLKLQEIALCMDGCDLLAQEKMFPDGLKYALSLEELLIFEMPGEFRDRVEGIDGRKAEAPLRLAQRKFEMGPSSSI
ncbi:hypothetical protein ACH5RR_031609 [Cinchona calisaya]|uniref:Uncharacterized protein n=1 Tax=Cinchona calisaya TaxID=153742 RepID=A0ABD2YK55_9GENT